ncbi:hypothetical protein [Tunturiibacter gelidiferens]|uniref:hypothetical protein n=1 Tax=Tunturiibacter gelidiferens TaxID=3069689 RepID=UPI003D9B93EB
MNPDKLWIALLPGSRTKEVRLNLPTMLDAAAALGNGYEYIVPVASTLKREWIERLMTSGGQRRERIGGPGRLALQHLVPDAREALHHARAGVVASGTATIQAALVGNPFLVVYRVSPLTFRLARRLIHYPRRSPPHLTRTATFPSPWSTLSPAAASCRSSCRTASPRKTWRPPYAPCFPTRPSASR